MDECKHEMDEESLVYDKRFGRRGKCKLCGISMIHTTFVNMDKLPRREHLTKKERKRAKELKIRDVHDKEVDAKFAQCRADDKKAKKNG
jgi:hypothetical protein